jgi:DNA-binding transcriptional LysR family regulator
MHDVDTSLLRTFVTLAETHSFSRTGSMIGRSQSAVSGQIQRLEQVLGRTLLIRNTRNVALTVEGERLLGHARQMIANADAMLARFATNEVEGLVRFGSPEDFATIYLPETLGLFAKAHPAVELRVTCQLTLPLVEAFEAGELDLIVVKQDPARRYDGAKPLWRESLVWVGAPDAEANFDAVLHGPSVLRLVASPAPCVYRSRAAEALDRAHVAWAGVFTSPSFAGCAAAVAAGFGYAVMPRGMVPASLRVLEDGWPPLAEAEIALLGAARLSAATEALASFIVQRVKR